MLNQETAIPRIRHHTSTQHTEDAVNGARTTLYDIHQYVGKFSARLVRVPFSEDAQTPIETSASCLGTSGLCKSI